MFHILLHDVTPQLQAPIAAIVEQLRPLVGNQMMAAVVPCWHGERLKRSAHAFIKFVRANFSEALLHGYTHQTGNGGPVGWLTGNANEFTGLCADDALGRLGCGQTVFLEIFGQPARGFVAPAWQRGSITDQVLAGAGIRYNVGLTGVETVDGHRIPLSTWSWDAGRIAALGYVGEAIGSVMAAARPGAAPCVVFHPSDVERGFLPRGIRLVKKLLAEGRKPIVFCEESPRCWRQSPPLRRKRRASA
jgi:predicted deacetylase